MASTVGRRPLPALIALIALLVLTGVIWWRVLNRDSSAESGKACPTPTAKPATVLPGPDAVTLQVLNSTTRAGIAGKARATFVDLGFNVPGAAGNDNRKVLNKIKTTAQIRYGPTASRSARLVRYYLPGAALVPTASKSSTVIVSLGTTYRGLATATSVQAQLKRDNAVAGTPTLTPSGSASCAA